MINMDVLPYFLNTFDVHPVYKGMLQLKVPWKITVARTREPFLGIAKKQTFLFFQATSCYYNIRKNLSTSL